MNILPVRMDLSEETPMFSAKNIKLESDSTNTDDRGKIPQYVHQAVIKSEDLVKTNVYLSNQASSRPILDMVVPTQIMSEPGTVVSDCAVKETDKDAIKEWKVLASVVVPWSDQGDLLKTTTNAVDSVKSGELLHITSVGKNNSLDSDNIGPVNQDPCTLLSPEPDKQTGGKHACSSKGCEKIVSPKDKSKKERRLMRAQKYKGKYQCTDCGKTFPSRGPLAVHQRAHTGEKPCLCSICGQRFSQPGNLSKHLRSHSAERPFTCPICGKGFTRREHVAAHERVHTDIKPYRCLVCGRSFSESSKLSSHQRIHTGEAQYNCTVCGMSFKTRTTFNVHRAKHSADKPNQNITHSEDLDIQCLPSAQQIQDKVNTSLVCIVCGKKLSLTGDLVRHERTHTGVKPYECDMCGRKYRLKHHLTRHQDKLKTCNKK